MYMYLYSSLTCEMYWTITLLAQKLNLKGQCHEMVVEVRPWSGSLDLN
jgi:hypothetical protein